MNVKSCILVNVLIQGTQDWAYEQTEHTSGTLPTLHLAGHTQVFSSLGPSLFA